MLERSAERGANRVRQILAFAHGNPGELRLLQPKNLLRQNVSVNEGTFPKSSRIEDQFPSDLPSLCTNATQIHQAVLNLCVNARDAMLYGGTLRLVITDLHMPNPDGATFDRALRRMNPAVRDLGFGRLTSALGECPDYKPEEFADGLLRKPFKPDRLLAKVHDMMNGPPPIRRPADAARQESAPPA